MFLSKILALILKTTFWSVAASLIILLLKCLVRFRQQMVLSRTIPQLSVCVPVLGHIIRIFLEQGDIVNLLRKKVASLPPTASKVMIALGPRIQVHHFHPEGVKAILESNTIISKATEYSYLNAWLGQGLLLSSHQKWHQRRKLLTPAFHFKILAKAIQIINEKADALAKSLNKGKSEDFIPTFPLLTRCALDVMVQAAMGLDLDSHVDEYKEYIDSTNAIKSITFQRVTNIILSSDVVFRLLPIKKRLDKHLNIVHAFTNNVIKERRAAMEQKVSNADERDDFMCFLDILLSARLEDGSMLSDSDIQEEVDTFMFEGHDTTACSLGWTTLLLGNHPEIQEKLFEEQWRIFGSNMDVDITTSHLSQMEFLDACIKESLRLYPSVPVVGRILEQEELINGTLLPKDTSVYVPIYLLHRNRLIWPHPDLFRPERFLDPEAPHRHHAFAYVPFSAGPRNCIGQKLAMMEMKIIFSKLIQKFTFECNQRIDEVEPIMDLTSQPGTSIPTRFVPRNN